MINYLKNGLHLFTCHLWFSLPGSKWLPRESRHAIISGTGAGRRRKHFRIPSASGGRDFFLICVWLPPTIWGRRIFEKNSLFTTKNIVCFQENFQNFNHWKYCIQNFTENIVCFFNKNSPLKILCVFSTKFHHWKYCMFFNVSFHASPIGGGRVLKNFVFHN